MKKINLPTILTLFRIVLVAPMLIFLYCNIIPGAIACFVVASITDFLDGRLARKNKQVTTLGKFLDPIADKLLVDLALLAFVHLWIMPVWVLGIVLARDIMVDGLRMVAAEKKVTIAASKLGKIKTSVQMLTILLYMINMMFWNGTFALINVILLIIAVILTVWSGADYLYKGRKLMI